MRVIAGRFRGRRLKSVPGLTVRPTPDRLREALFNVLAPRIEGAVFLDAYAGSGAVGIEAASRGAGRVVLIERGAPSLAIIRENLASLQLEKEVTVVRGSAAALIASYPADIAFIDPPYEAAKEYELSLLALSDLQCPLAIAQHDAKTVLGEQYGGLRRVRVLRQGSNALSFYNLHSEALTGE